MAPAYASTVAGKCSASSVDAGGKVAPAVLL
jgi:hypothetical protein